MNSEAELVSAQATERGRESKVESRRPEQRGRKLQTPNSKLQGSAKHQAPERGRESKVESRGPEQREAEESSKRQVPRSKVQRSEVRSQRRRAGAEGKKAPNPKRQGEGEGRRSRVDGRS